VLVSRTALFACIQASIAGGYAAAGDAEPWLASAAWWPATATIGSVAGCVLVHTLLRREASSFWHLFAACTPFDARSFKGIGWVLCGLPLALGLGVALGFVLFADPALASAMLIRPLPLGVAVALVVAFPLAMATTELPTYFGYVMPRLATSYPGRPLLAVGMPVLWLSGQHVALPLLLDAPFVVWRALMFLPLATLFGLALHWRPRLLPHLAVLHGLLDAQAAVTILLRSMA
jgi:hypothetical protein